jgi:transcription factor TFIIIB component B''
MLKNRGKIFAPKAKGIVRRQPSAAPTSARPSVERQSQTPAPRQEIAGSVAEEGTAAESIQTSDPVAKVSSQEESSLPRTRLPDVSTHRHPSPDTRKRKTRDEDAPEPPAKRIPTNINRAESFPPLEASTQSYPETPSHPGSATPRTQENNLKRKEQENVSVDPPAKRVPTNVDSQVQPTTRAEIPQQVQNAEATPRAASTLASEPAELSEAIHQARELSEAVAENIEAENNEDERSQSSREPTFQAPAHRYPSPEGMQIARIVDNPAARLGSMGPAGGNGPGLGAAGDIGAAGRIIQSAHLSEIVPRGVLNPDGTSGGIIEEAASGTEKTAKKGKRKYIKRKKVQAPEIGDDGRATVEMQLIKPRREKGQRRRRKAEGPRERNQRAATPEGAEEEEIDRESMTMSDLCKDLKIGKAFSMHGEIKARQMKKKADLARAKLRKDHPELIPLMDAEDNAASGEAAEIGVARPSGTRVAQPAASEELEIATPAGPQMRIIDGQIVVDERTLQIDRQKNAQAQRLEMTEIEENDFTRVITSGTWMKMERSQVWDAAANELFYECLRAHGTDFEMIASYFPHRNRRQIKLKFNKEERNNPHKITKAMTQPKKPIDLEHFQKMSSIQLVDVADIDKEREEYDQEQMAEQSKHEAAKAEDTRKKKEAIQATSAAARRVLATVELSDIEEDEPGRVAGGESAKENREPAGRSKSADAPAAKGKKKAAPKKPRKNKHSHYAGGDEVEVLGTID